VTTTYAIYFAVDFSQTLLYKKVGTDMFLLPVCTAGLPNLNALLANIIQNYKINTI